MADIGRIKLIIDSEDRKKFVIILCSTHECVNHSKDSDYCDLKEIRIGDNGQCQRMVLDIKKMEKAATWLCDLCGFKNYKVYKGFRCKCGNIYS